MGTTSRGGENCDGWTRKKCHVFSLAKRRQDGTQKDGHSSAVCPELKKEAENQSSRLIKRASVLLEHLPHVVVALFVFAAEPSACTGFWGGGVHM